MMADGLAVSTEEAVVGGIAARVKASKSKVRQRRGESTDDDDERRLAVFLERTGRNTLLTREIPPA